MDHQSGGVQSPGHLFQAGNGSGFRILLDKPRFPCLAPRIATAKDPVKFQPPRSF
jgi:hypothetical protein